MTRVLEGVNERTSEKATIPSSKAQLSKLTRTGSGKPVPCAFGTISMLAGCGFGVR
jgi:hypothetical protein